MAERMCIQMDIKTRLKDDNVLFSRSSNSSSTAQILGYLEKKESLL